MHPQSIAPTRLDACPPFESACRAASTQRGSVTVVVVEHVSGRPDWHRSDQCCFLTPLVQLEAFVARPFFDPLRGVSSCSPEFPPTAFNSSQCLLLQDAAKSGPCLHACRSILRACAMLQT